MDVTIVPACFPLPQKTPCPGACPSRITPRATPPAPIPTLAPTVFTGWRRYSAADCNACRVFAQTGQGPFISLRGGRRAVCSILAKYARSPAVRGSSWTWPFGFGRGFLANEPSSFRSFGSISPAADRRRFLRTRLLRLDASSKCRKPLESGSIDRSEARPLPFSVALSLLSPYRPEPMPSSSWGLDVPDAFSWFAGDDER